jgi:hypothetical protein
MELSHSKQFNLVPLSLRAMIRNIMIAVFVEKSVFKQGSFAACKKIGTYKPCLPHSLSNHSSGNII